MKPRALIAYWFVSARATSRFGARRSASGSVVAPLRRMSSAVITYTDAGGRRERLVAARDRHDHDVGELLERQVGQVGRARDQLRVRGGHAHRQRGEHGRDGDARSRGVRSAPGEPSRSCRTTRACVCAASSRPRTRCTSAPAERASVRTRPDDVRRAARVRGRGPGDCSVDPGGAFVVVRGGVRRRGGSRVGRTIEAFTKAA